MPQHSTLIAAAEPVAKALTEAGFVPHPGRINPRRGRGPVRAVYVTEPHRTRITVKGNGGAQDLFIYGAVDPQDLIAVLRARLGDDAVEEPGVDRTDDAKPISKRRVRKARVPKAKTSAPEHITPGRDPFAGLNGHASPETGGQHTYEQPVMDGAAAAPADKAGAPSQIGGQLRTETPGECAAVAPVAEAAGAPLEPGGLVDSATPSCPSAAGASVASAADAPLSDGRNVCDSPALVAVAGASAQADASPYLPDPRTAEIVALIRKTYKRRTDYLRSEMSLTIRMKAACRRMVTKPGMAKEDSLEEAQRLFDHMMKLADGDPPRDPHPLAADALDWNRALMLALEPLRAERKAIEKYLATVAPLLPIWPWVEKVRGFGAGSLANVIGEVGDIGNYRSVSGLWKRLGLGLVQWTNDAGDTLCGRQRLVAGNPELAIKHGYSPQRRAVMWVIGDVLVKQNRDFRNPQAPAPYRSLYDERKAYEYARDPEIKPIVAHRRAQRYIEKRLLRELWKAWRAAETASHPRENLPPAYTSAAIHETNTASMAPRKRRGRKPAASSSAGTLEATSTEDSVSRPQAAVPPASSSGDEPRRAALAEELPNTSTPRDPLPTGESPARAVLRQPSSNGRTPSAPIDSGASRMRTAHSELPSKETPPSAPSSDAVLRAQTRQVAHRPRTAQVPATPDEEKPSAPNPDARFEMTANTPMHRTRTAVRKPLPGNDAPSATPSGASRARPTESHATPTRSTSVARSSVAKRDAYSPRAGMKRNGVRTDPVPPLGDFGPPKKVYEGVE